MHRTDRSSRPVPSGAQAPDTGIAIITGVVVAVLLAAPMLRIPSVYDEGFALVNAVRIGDGQLPYLDFWTVYTPGEYYLLAGLFQVFGESILVARASDLVLQGLLCWQIYALLRPRTGAARAGVVTILLALLIAVSAQPLYPVLIAVALSLAALRLVAPALGPGGGRLALPAVGALAGAAGWFRQDDGVYTVLMVLVVASVARLSDLDSPRLRARVTRLVKDGGAVAAGLAAAFAVLFLPWAIGVPFHVLVDQLVVHPASVLPEARRIPLPGPVPPSGNLARFALWLYFYAVLAVSVAGVVVLWLRRRLVTGPRARDRAEWLVRLGVLVLVLSHIAPMTGRFDIPHALPCVTLALVLAALLVSWDTDEAAPGKPTDTTTAGRGSLMTVVSAFMVLLALWPLLTFMRTLSAAPPWRCVEGPARAHCVNLNPDELRAVQLIQERTSPEDPLFVGDTRHDEVLYNDALFYFLADRPVATRYHEYSPLVTDTLSVQREMVRELERAQPPWVVLFYIPPSTEDNASSRSSGVVVLDEWIREHYVPDTSVGSYQLWRLADG